MSDLWMLGHPDDQPKPGTAAGYLLGRRYAVGEVIGFGGMSEVHRARDLRLGRDVAVKFLRADFVKDPSYHVRFSREAQNAASLNHPAIVAVYDTGESDSDAGPIPYLIMEYVDGTTLRDLIQRDGTFGVKQSLEITADLCAALDFSHRHGIVHRDIKPANVMLTRSGAVKVADFGIARAVSDGQTEQFFRQAVIGTVAYMSPEQCRGEAVDARADVYSIGCLLYELLVGRQPFVGHSPVAVAHGHLRSEPPKPSDGRSDLPAELDAIVRMALSKSPLERFQTAADMRSAAVRALTGLTEVTGGGPLAVKPDHLHEKLRLARAGESQNRPFGAGDSGASGLLARIRSFSRNRKS